MLPSVVAVFRHTLTFAQSVDDAVKSFVKCFILKSLLYLTVVPLDLTFQMETGFFLQFSLTALYNETLLSHCLLSTGEHYSNWSIRL